MTYEETRYYTPEEVATKLQVTRRTVYRWLTEGKLPGLRAGAGWRITEAAVERFLREQR
jgi:excisionase family DNA binding protein